MKRLLSGLLLLALLLTAMPAACAEGGMQECHRVTASYDDTTQSNKSGIRLWKVETALKSVDEEVNGLAQAYVNEIAPTLQKGKATGDKNSRLDVAIRYSKTGLTWMSFMVQARTTYHRDLIGQEFVTRTYDMTTGERILLTDIFDEDSEGWDILRSKVEETVRYYFPEEEPDETALAAYLTDEGLRDLEFTLHGMSLVIHIPASSVYPSHLTLIEVTLFYPDIREYMTEKAQIETDNMTYYKTVALTFDDGPTRTNTTKVLNNLLTVGAPATFFMVGKNMKSYDDLVQRAHDEGHAIGSHNWTHGDARKTSASTLRAMPAKVNKALTSIIGIPVRYDRVPYGVYPAMISAKVGWAYIQWSVDTYDWRGRSTNTIMNNVKKQFTNGDIVLMHDIKDNTPNTAKVMASWLYEQGYILLTIDELFASCGVTLEADTVYFRCDDGVTTIK